MTTLPNSSNKTARATLLALALVCVLGGTALYQGTMGLRVVSTEDGRRLDIRERPRALPAASIHLPQPSTLHAALQGDGRVAIVAFMYTSCNAVCSVLGSEFQQLQAEIRARGLQRQVRLLSISFDPRDTPAVLAAYAANNKAEAGLWQFVSVDDAAQRRRLLDAFGIVVLPAPLGEFQHNAAFHLVGADARLMRVDDFDRPASALEHALTLARQAGRLL
jgi:protein SCO1/2